MEKTDCALTLMQRAGFRVKTSPRIRYQASDSATIFAMVQEGLSITLVLQQMLPSKLYGHSFPKLQSAFTNFVSSAVG